MNWKVKALIEFLEKNYKGDDTIFTFIYDRREVGNSFGVEATESEWERIAEGLGGSYSSDALYEEFSDSVSEVLGHLRCDDCYEYTRDIITIEDSSENLCAGCVEVRKAIAEKEEQRTKDLVKPDEDIVY
jgi:hypothetical protein